MTVNSYGSDKNRRLLKSDSEQAAIESSVPAMASYKRHAPSTGTVKLAFALLAASVPATMAQNCVSLAGSTQCPAFNGSSISTGESTAGLL
jgi:hypothetical protein